jgi:hypothetical protein
MNIQKNAELIAKKLLKSHKANTQIGLRSFKGKISYPEITKAVKAIFPCTDIAARRAHDEANRLVCALLREHGFYFSVN